MSLFLFLIFKGYMFMGSFKKCIRKLFLHLAILLLEFHNSRTTDTLTLCNCKYGLLPAFWCGQLTDFDAWLVEYQRECSMTTMAKSCIELRYNYFEKHDNYFEKHLNTWMYVKLITVSHSPSRTILFACLFIMSKCMLTQPDKALICNNLWERLQMKRQQPPKSMKENIVMWSFQCLLRSLLHSRYSEWNKSNVLHLYTK